MEGILAKQREERKKRQRVETEDKSMDGHKSKKQTSGMEQIKKKRKGSIAKKESRGEKKEQ